MKQTNPPRFLILTFVAAFLFAFAAGAMFFWPQAKVTISETPKAEQVEK
jgi:hypothetical protein